MTWKLKILGPYTPDHNGPFCTRDKVPVEIAIKKDRNGNSWGYIGDDTSLTEWQPKGQFDPTRMSDSSYDLMNAEEVPFPRELWIIGTTACTTKDRAETIRCAAGFPHAAIIHVREVLPGEGE